MPEPTDLQTFPPQRRFSVNGLAQLVQLCRDHAIDPEPLLREAGVELQALRNPHGWITSTQEFRFLAALQRRWPTPTLGLLAGQRYRLGALGLLGSAVHYCATGHQAMRFFIEHISLSYTYFLVEMMPGPEQGCLVLRDQYDLGGLRRYFIDRDLLFAVNAWKDVMPQAEQAIRRVQLAYPAPPEQALYRQAFGCEVQFGVAISKIEFDSAWLDVPFHQANELTLQLLEEQCRQLEARLSPQGRLSDEIRRLLAREEGELPSLEDLARRLHTTSRTLRRRLREEGEGYREILEEILRARARLWLEQGQEPLEMIAERLGYAEPASFIHAFKRWTGETPGQYRRRRQEADSAAGDDWAPER